MAKTGLLRDRRKLAAIVICSLILMLVIAGSAYPTAVDGPWPLVLMTFGVGMGGGIVLMGLAIALIYWGEEKCEAPGRSQHQRDAGKRAP